MYRTQRQRHAPKEMTGVQQEAQLVAMLYQCRPHMLDTYTVDGLLRTHGKVGAKRVEYLLILARQNRAGEAR